MLIVARKKGSLEVSLRSSMDLPTDKESQPLDQGELIKKMLGSNPFVVKDPHTVQVCKGLSCSEVTLSE